MGTTPKRPTLTTTTDAGVMADVQAIEVSEMRTRASVVEELLRLGLAARARRNLARVGGGRPVRSRRAHAQQSTARVAP